MKTPRNPDDSPADGRVRELPPVRLRAVSEVAPAPNPQDLGNLAPPYDPRRAARRRLRDYAVWGLVAFALASVVGLGLWFVAR